MLQREITTSYEPCVSLLFGTPMGSLFGGVGDQNMHAFVCLSKPRFKDFCDYQKAHPKAPPKATQEITTNLEVEP